MTLSCSRKRRVEMISERITDRGRSGYSRRRYPQHASRRRGVWWSRPRRSMDYGAKLDISKNTTVRVGLGRKFVCINKRMTRSKLRVRCTRHDVVMITLLRSSSTVFYFISPPTREGWLEHLPHTHSKRFGPYDFSRRTLTFCSLSWGRCGLITTNSNRSVGSVFDFFFFFNLTMTQAESVITHNVMYR